MAPFLLLPGTLRNVRPTPLRRVRLTDGRMVTVLPGTLFLARQRICSLPNRLPLVNPEVNMPCVFLNMK